MKVITILKNRHNINFNFTIIMKRVLFSMVLLMAVSFSFAQMKNVKEAKSIANDVKPNFKQAEQLIEEAMKNPETKDLADTWDVAGFIQKRINEEQMKNAFLKKPQGQKRRPGEFRQGSMRFFPLWRRRSVREMRC